MCSTMHRGVKSRLQLQQEWVAFVSFGAFETVGVTVRAASCTTVGIVVGAGVSGDDADFSTSVSATVGAAGCGRAVCRTSDEDSPLCHVCGKYLKEGIREEWGRKGGEGHLYEKLTVFVALHYLRLPATQRRIGTHVSHD